MDNVPPYLVPEVLRAYDAEGLGVTGAGQTIAILIDTLPEDADLQAFWKANGLPTTIAQIQKVNVKNGPLPPPEGEESLDVEWSSGVAPGATIRVYASGSLRFVDLDLALDRIIADLAAHPTMRQLSISLGLGEKFMGGPNGEVAVQHQKFLKLAAAGVNVFVSSGDAGSNPDDSGHSATGPTQAEYESSDGVGEQRRREEHLLPAARVAEGTRRPDGQDAARARREPCGGPEHRRLPHPARQGRADRRHELERSGVGGLLRAHQRGTREGRQGAARVPESAALSARRHGVLPRHHDREQRRVQGQEGLRPGHRAGRA
jgi:hypothetical protein